MNYIDEIKQRWDAYKELGTTETVHNFVNAFVVNLYTVDNAHIETIDYEIEKFVREYLYSSGEKLYTVELDYVPDIENTVFSSIREILKSALRHILNIELNKYVDENKSNK